VSRMCVPHWQDQKVFFLEFHENPLRHGLNFQERVVLAKYASTRTSPITISEFSLFLSQSPMAKTPYSAFFCPDTAPPLTPGDTTIPTERRPALSLSFPHCLTPLVPTIPEEKDVLSSILHSCEEICSSLFIVPLSSPLLDGEFTPIASQSSEDGV